MLCLSENSFGSNDVEQLFLFYAPATNDITALCFGFALFFHLLSLL